MRIKLNSNKGTSLIAILIFIILILSCILIIKVKSFKNKSEINNAQNIEKINYNYTDTEENNEIKNNEEEISTKTYNIKNDQLRINKIDDKYIIRNIADIIILLLIIPFLLKRYKLYIGIIFLTIYNILIFLFTSSTLSLLPILIIVPFFLLYNYLLLLITEKILLDISLISYVIGFIFLQFILYYTVMFLYSILLMIILV